MKGKPFVLRREQGLAAHVAAWWSSALPWSIVLLSWSYYAGKDLNWDLQNYHYYLGAYLAQGRDGLDFFPASVQSYLNPLPHLPFYWLNRLGLPALVVGSVLAVSAVFNLMAIRRIAALVMPMTFGNRAFFVEGAVALSALSPIFLAEVGTSYVDVLVSIPCLYAVYFLLAQTGLPRWHYVWAAGFLLGLAVGLKPTTVLFAAIACLCFLVNELIRNWRNGLNAMLVLIVSGFAGLLLTEGWWAWHLYGQYGNPVFPLLNDVFQSDWFPHLPLANARFACRSWHCVFEFPLDVLNARLHTYAEIHAPDGRFILGLIFLPCFALRTAKLALVTNSINTDWSRCGNMLTAIVWLNVVMWLWSSANARYAMPMLLLFGPLLVYLLCQSGLPTKAVPYALLVFILAQGVLTFIGSDRRFNPAPWGGRWVELRLPNGQTDLPRDALFLSLNNQSVSVLVDKLGPNSRFINLIGQKTIEPLSKAGRHVADLVKHAASVRTLYLPDAPVEFAVTMDRAFRQQNALLSTYGLRAKSGSCKSFYIKDALLGGSALLSTQEQKQVGPRASLDLPVVSCEVELGVPEVVVAAWSDHALEEANGALDGFEAYCRTKVGKEHSQSELGETNMRRGYINSDFVAIWSQHDQVVWLWHFDRFLGRFSPHAKEQDAAIKTMCSG